MVIVCVRYRPHAHTSAKRPFCPTVIWRRRRVTPTHSIRTIGRLETRAIVATNTELYRLLLRTPELRCQRLSRRQGDNHNLQPTQCTTKFAYRPRGLYIWFAGDCVSCTHNADRALLTLALCVYRRQTQTECQPNPTVSLSHQQ
jgi:hypothetical protein